MAKEKKRFLNDSYALESLRETGYKSTAYAISELIDNSIDAEANEIHLIAKEEHFPNIPGRHKYQITEIGIIDDGLGFPKDTLDDCLSIGFGTKKDTDSNKSSIGKFGYGLKGGSISQCRRFEVYSWNEGEKPYYCYMDLDDIKAGNPFIPDVQERDLPIHFKPLAKEKGTLIVWQKLDEVDYKTTKGLFGTMIEDLSRIFRNFLDDDDTYGRKREITMRAVDEKGKQKGEVIFLKANDPTYLLKPNTLPDLKPGEVQSEHKLSLRATNEIFEKYSKEVEYRDHNNELKTSKIEFIFTIADTDIQALGGNSAVGVHYGKNDNGISFMRACREIEQSEKQIQGVTDSDPRHRWWGAEIRFNRELDKLFGVDAAKQRIRNIKKINPDLMDQYKEDSFGKDQSDLVKKLNLMIHTEVGKQVKKMMGKIKSRREGSKLRKESGVATPQEQLNKELKRSNELENAKSTKEAQIKDIEVKKQEAIERIKSRQPNITEEELNDATEEFLNMVVTFNKDTWGQFGSFLATKYVANSLEVLINTDHPFYDNFYDKFDQDELTRQPVEALKIILQGYALAEDKLSHLDQDGRIYPKLKDEWGRFVADYIDKANLSD